MRFAGEQLQLPADLPGLLVGGPRLKRPDGLKHCGRGEGGADAHDLPRLLFGGQVRGVPRGAGWRGGRGDRSTALAVAARMLLGG